MTSSASEPGLRMPFIFFSFSFFFLFFAERKIFMSQFMAQGGWGIYFSAKLCNFSSTIYKRCCIMILFCFVFFFLKIGLQRRVLRDMVDQAKCSRWFVAVVGWIVILHRQLNNTVRCSKIWVFYWMLIWGREFMNFTFESPQTNDLTNGIPAGF